jgi:hypothetical protein
MNAADALHGAAGDEPRLGLREADERSDSEDDDAEEEHRRRPKMSPRRPGHEQAKVSAGVDGPFEAADRGVQILLDRR